MSKPTIQQEPTTEDQAEFQADLAYLHGLAEAIFAYASPQDLLHIAAFDGDRA